MYKYFIKTPWWIRKIFSSYVWRIPSQQKIVYLTFDDGPHPAITPWVLAQLRIYNAKATFFCIGNNVQQHPLVYEQIINEGHAVGNHTHHHLNGWKTETSKYITDVALASQLIRTSLFRPPYGKIRLSQAKGVAAAMNLDKAKIIMWDVLSGDFDRTISPDQCIKNVMEHTSAGSVIVFHDSEKAFANLEKALPAILKELAREGYEFRKIIMDSV